MTIPCLVLHLTLFSGLTLAEEPGEKAKRYHSALLKRPSGGYLFDRFLNSWIDTGTIDGLDEFLKGRSKTETATSADRLLYGFFLTRMGRDEEALAVYEEALVADPENAEAWAEAAKAKAASFEFEEALRDINKALEFSEDDEDIVELTKQKGRWLSRSGKTDEAIETWNQLVEDYPDDDELREDLVDLQLDENLASEAVATQKALVESTRDPYHKITRNLRLGDIYLKAGDADEAKAIYTSSLDSAGRDTWLEKQIIAQIESLFRREDNLTGLKTHYLSLLESTPGRIAVLRRLASVHAELEEGDEAVEVFQNILKVTPGDRANREEFIQLLGRLDKTDEAVVQMKALAESFPEDAELKAQLATWQHEAGEADAAIASVEQFLAQSDQSEYSYLRAGRLLEQFSQTDAAKKIYQTLVDTFPESVGAVDERAAFLYRIGEKEEAVAIWKKIAATGTSSDAIRAARMLGSRGERESAYEILKERAEDFTEDFVYLGRLCSEGLASDHAEEVLPWAEKRLSLAESPVDFDDALRQMLSILNRTEKDDETKEALLAKGDDRTLADACLLSELLEGSGEFEAATTILEPWIEKGEFIAMGQRVRQLESRNEWAAAAEAMQQIVEQPDGARSNYLEKLISLYQRSLNPEKALHWVEEWKKASPGSSRPWLTQARILHDENKTDEAITVLRKTVGRFDDEETARIQLASLFEQSGKASDADRIYWNLYEGSEDIGSKLRWAASLASSAQSQGNVDHLLKQFEERKRANRTSIAPLLSIAEIHRRTDNYEGRREALMEATRLRPEDLSLLQQIARIEESEGDWERAVETLESALTLDKTDDTARRIALLHLRYGEEEEGYRHFTELAGGEEMDEKTVIGLADAMIARNDWERALELLNQHADRFPGHYELQYLRAISLEETQANELAVEAFLSLLEIDTEHDPKKLKLSQLSSQSQSNRSSYYDLFPEGTREITNLQRARYEGFQYRQALRSQQVRFPTNPMTGSSGLVKLPQTIEQLHDYAVVHLHGLAQWLEEENASENLAREMKLRGIDHAALILATTHTDQYTNESPITPETLEKFPESEILHGYNILMESNQLSNRRAAKDGAQLIKSIQILRDEYPEIALLGAIAAASTWEESAYELLTELLEENVALDGVILRNLQSTGSSLLLNFSTEAFPDKLQNLLLKRLAEWKDLSIAYNRERAKKPNSISYLYFYPSDNYAAILRRSEDLTSYAAYLDEQIASFEELASKNNQASTLATQSGLGIYYRYANQRRPLLSPFGFPALETPMIPGNVIGQFVAVGGIYRPYDEVPLDAEKAAAVAPLAKNPWLRAFFYAAAEQPDKANKIVETQLAEATKGGKRLPLQTAILSAGWYQNQEKWEKAGAILESIRRTPMGRVLRQRIDANLVHCAMEAGISETEEKNEGLAATGPAAALRLRYSFLSPQGRGELVTALEGFGLSKESERLASQGIQAPNSSSSRTASVRANVAQGFEERIQQLVKDGKSENAVNVLTKTLQQNVSAMASTGGAQWDYDLIRLVYTIERQDSDVLRKAVAQLKPGEESPAKKHLEFAFLHQLNRNLKESLRYLKSGIEKLPESSRSKYYAVITVTEACRDAENSMVWFEKMGPREIAKLPSAIAAVTYPIDYSSDSGETEARLNLARAVQLWIENNVDAFSNNRSDTSWIEDQIRGRLEWLDRYPRLFAKGAYSQVQYSSQSSKNMTERDEVHQDLCLSMIKIPQLAHIAFTKYATHEIGTSGENAFTDPKLVALANEALSNYARKGNSRTISGSRSYNYFPADFHTSWSPAEFLLYHAFLTEEEPGDELARLTKSRDLDERVAAEAFERMLFGEPAEFENALRKYINQPRYVPANHSYSYVGEQCINDVRALSSRAFRIWKAREEELANEFELKTFLLAQVSKQKKTLQSEATLLAYRFIEEEVSKNGWDATEPYFLELTNEWLGESSKWDKFAKTTDNSQGYSREGYAELSHRQYAGFLSVCGWNPALVFPISKFVQENGLDDNGQVTSNTLLSRIDNDYFRKDPNFLTQLYAGGPFLEGEDGFDPILIDTEPKPRMLTILEAARRQSPEAQKEFAKLFADADTLGKQLSAAFWEKEKAKKQDGILTAFAQSKEAIESMPEKQIEGLAALVAQAFPEGVPESEAAHEVASILDQLGAARAKGLVEKAEEFLALDDLRKANLTYHSALVRELGPHLNPLLQSGNSELMESLYWHATSLITAEQKKRGWGSYDSGWNSYGDLLYDLLDDTSGGGIERIAFYERLMRNDKDGKIAISLTGRFSAFLKSHFDNEGGISKLEPALTATFSRLWELAGEEASPAYLAICSEFFPLRLKPAETVRAIAWADKMAASKSPLQPLARELAMTWRRGMTTNGAKPQLAQRSKVKEIDAWIPYTLTHLQDESIPYNIRIQIAGRACRAKLEHSDEALVLAAAKVLGEGLAVDAPLNGWRYVDVVNRFNQLPVDEAWKAVALQIDEGWVHKNRNNHREDETGLPWDPWSNPVFLTLELYGKLGDREKMSRFLAEGNAKSRLEGNARAFFGLFYFGFPEEALKELDRSLSKVDIGTDFPTRQNDFNPYYNSSVHEKVEPFLATIENEPRRFLAELLLRGMPDLPAAEKEKNPPYPPRHKRTENLAKQFLEIDFSKASAERESAIRQLAEYDNSARILKEPIREAAAGFRLQPVINKQNRDQIRYLMRFPAANATFELREGKVAQVRSFLTELQESNGSEYYQQKTLEYFSQRIGNSLKNRHPFMQPTEVQAYADALHLLIGQPKRDFIDHEQIRIVSVAKILADVISETHPETSSSLVSTQFSEPRLKYLREKLTNGNAGQFWSHLTTGLKFQTPNPALQLDDEARHQRIEAVLSHPLSSEVVAKEGDLWEKLLQNKWVTAEEKGGDWAKQLLAKFGAQESEPEK